MARITLGDVLRGKSPNKEAEVKRAAARATAKRSEEMVAKTNKTRMEDPYANEPTKMLKEGTRNRSPKITTSGKENITKGGVYPTYNKGSVESESFKKAFSTARKAGSKDFTWNGKKYNTKVK